MTDYRQPIKCRRCGNDDIAQFPHQVLCVDCDPWRGHKLCDGDGCFELYVPSRAEKIMNSNSRRPLWFCPKCRGQT
jgi:hypothetical protein